MVLMPHLDFHKILSIHKKVKRAALLTVTPLFTGHHAIPLPCLPPLQ